jgi:hypothetical protein
MANEVELEYVRDLSVVDACFEEGILSRGNLIAEVWEGQRS